MSGVALLCPRAKDSRSDISAHAAFAACHISGDVHAGLEVLQPAIARQADQRNLSDGDCTQLLCLAAAAAACLAEASTLLHVSPVCLIVCKLRSCWVLVCLSACVWKQVVCHVGDKWWSCGVLEMHQQQCLLMRISTTRKCLNSGMHAVIGFLLLQLLIHV